MKKVLKLRERGKPRVHIFHGDNDTLLDRLQENSIDSIVCDPPYALNFMGKGWDTGDVAFSKRFWKKALRVLKPGGHIIAFGGSRTYHRMACAIEDAGFEIRDSLMWLYSTGFPKSVCISKAIDKAYGVERKVVGKRKHPTLKDTSKLTEKANAAHGGNSWAREWVITAPATPDAEVWEGWGTALKPAFEPIVLARKPLSEKTIAENVLKWRTGALNIDGCRIEGKKDVPASPRRTAQRRVFGDLAKDPGTGSGWNPTVGRHPANIMHDGSTELVGLFPATKSALTGGAPASAARFFYCPKASKKDRTEDGEVQNIHPTVKPTALMRYLCRLVTPTNGRVLDLFMGSGSTGKGALLEGFTFIGIDLEKEYTKIACRRLSRTFSKIAYQHHGKRKTANV